MENQKGLLQSYIIGFILSIVLTLVSYIVVMSQANSGRRFYSHETVIIAILVLAFIQLIVQLMYFLHLGREAKPRWKLGIFISFISIILIVVVASIWIMTHLNYNMSLVQFNNLMKYGEGF